MPPNFRPVLDPYKPCASNESGLVRKIPLLPRARALRRSSVCQVRRPQHGIRKRTEAPLSCPVLGVGDDPLRLLDLAAVPVHA